jgi:hypothetical protein
MIHTLVPFLTIRPISGENFEIICRGRLANVFINLKNRACQ